MGDRTTYASTGLEIPDDPGDPVISDFGDAQYGEGDFDGEVMPDLYRAPEIILGIPWDEKIDIWALGLMVRDQPAARGLPIADAEISAVTRFGICSRGSFFTTPDTAIGMHPGQPTLRGRYLCLDPRRMISWIEGHHGKTFLTKKVCRRLFEYLTTQAG